MSNELGRKVIPIHNSDQEAFLSCRNKWDLTSILRQAYRPMDMPKPLKFGICMHQGYEALYNPMTWHMDKDLILDFALAEFRDAMRKVRDKYLDDIEQIVLDEIHQAEYEEMWKLGQDMLRLYDTIARRIDEGWTPLGVEESWEVPLGFSIDGAEVVFRFRTDLRMQDPFGDQWLWDHKTTARMSESVDFLAMDPQMGKYLWGLRELGFPMVGAMYNEQYKSVPDKPAVLKVPRLGRKLSTSKSQDTTYDLMLEAIMEHGEKVEMYEDYLEWLKNSTEVKQYVRRTQIRRSDYELEQQHKVMTDIAIEMVDNPRIYPSPGRFKCDWCMVKDVCLQQQDGSDWQWTLNNKYHKVKDHYGHAV